VTAQQKPDPVALAIEYALVSPNEMDRNFENANVVDGLFAISRALWGVAKAIDHLAIAQGYEDEEED
jgi:hypothetical protein